jgi:glycosylphosphatidylinositol transamidase (GPIT) subunit GPI8
LISSYEEEGLTRKIEYVTYEVTVEVIQSFTTLVSATTPQPMRVKVQNMPSQPRAESRSLASAEVYGNPDIYVTINIIVNVIRRFSHIFILFKLVIT